MRAYIKYFVVFTLIFVFLAASSLSVSAESSFEALPVTCDKLWSNHVDDNTYYQHSSNDYTVNIPYNSGKQEFASIWGIKNSDTTNYYNYKFCFEFLYITPQNFTCTFNNTVYEVKRDTTYSSKYYIQIDNVKLSTTNMRLEFSFTFDAKISGSMYFQSYYQYSDLNSVIDNQNQNTDKIIENQNENTDKILDAGSDVPQPDFDSTNGQINDTVGQMESIEGQFKIDQDSTQAALDDGNSFWQGSYMQRASVQVKNWIERFADDNTDMSGFFVAAMVLGLCFWIIGRKAGSG